MPDSPPPIPDELRERPPAEPKPPSKTASAVTGLGDLSKALAIGLDFLATIAAGALLGWLLDRWRGWSPYGMVAGIGVGFLFGTVRLIRRLNK